MTDGRHNVGPGPGPAADAEEPQLVRWDGSAWVPVPGTQYDPETGEVRILPRRRLLCPAGAGPLGLLAHHHEKLRLTTVHA
jgi:hypothetical protein